MKDLKPAERLIVALDYSPGDCNIPCVASLEDKVLGFAKQLAGSGVCVKINSVLRAYGYLLIAKLHELGLRVMADLKLVDIPATLEKDGQWLEMAPPEILTVMACSGIDGMHALQKVLGDKTEILAVTVLTSLNEEECQAIFSCSTKAGVLRFARMAQLAKMGG
ncbi:orotidine 5'-phosphate decarboxylase, partial [Patescibacteria group bacterium]|nr:orotidine 5'-phosphate decarboxylase [Patescibacteria group bacterium]